MSRGQAFLKAQALVLAMSLAACGGSGGYVVSDHYNGERFVSPEMEYRPGLLDVLKWKLTTTPASWPERVENKAQPFPPRSVTGSKMRVTFINHATALIQCSGLNILTDPIWSERSSPVSWVGPKRVRDAGLRFDQLPPIHVVLISHDHYDHLDLPTLKRLEKVFSPKILVGLGNREWLWEEGLRNVVEMDWWHREEINDKVAIHFTPANHNSGRGLFDQDATLWGSFVIESPAGNVYFAGDTAYGSHFKEARKRLGPFRLSLLPIGAYEPRWFMKNVHVNPEEAVQAHKDLQAKTSVGVHFGTFQLTDEALMAPVEDLKRALKKAKISEDAFRVLDFGEGIPVPPLD